ncbi:putative metallo-hydrolase oxidoreductase [Lyophyllum shimeji]|uniref:Metallo-hydrolase oxidoreductase n=1 Tax=Lyophyllum shimeji TaxID=47721 RepID=A0A9P3PRG9_LYOSH|nr:putative metallo-hydrolase oxidoreductase [Lyophyllum shimeji]
MPADSDSSRTITVLYFAAASTATKLTEEHVPLPGDAPFSLSSLAALLVSRHPDTELGKVLEGSQWSVDAEMVDNPETCLEGEKDEGVSHSLPYQSFKVYSSIAQHYMIEEYNDIYSEHPFIYVKVVPSSNTLVVVDTGCGGASDHPDEEITSLREFTETVGLDDEGNSLNEGVKMRYTVVITHCHYDHILSDRYIIPGSDGMMVIHTPGHTPDELAIYDAKERMLYVGDSLYEHEQIIFPSEGSIVAWFASIESLISLVQSHDKSEDMQDAVLLNVCHCTVAQPALEVSEAARLFMGDVVELKEDVKKRLVIPGETNVVYRQKGGRFLPRCPGKSVEEAREQRAH